MAGRSPENLDPLLLTTVIAESTTLVQWLIIRDERHPFETGLVRSRRSWALLDSESLASARDHIRTFVSLETERVLVVPASSDRGVSWVSAELRRVDLRAEISTVACRERDPRRAAVRVLESLGAESETAGDPITELGRVLRARDRTRPSILVVPFEGSREATIDLARRAAESMLDPSVRLVIVAASMLGSRRDQVVPVVTHAFRIDSREIERGLAERLARADLDPGERARMALGLASFASGRGAVDDALGHAETALALAIEIRSTELLVAGLYVAGCVLGRAGRADEAVSAWVSCAGRALDAGQPLVAGRALSAIGHAYYGVGAWEPACRCYVAATELAREAADASGAMHAATWLAEAQAKTGREADAAVTLDRVSATSVPGLDTLLAAQRGEAYARLGRMLTRVGLSERASRAVHAAAREGYSGPLTACPGHAGAP